MRGDRERVVEGRANIRLEYKACSISGNQPLDTATSTGRLMLAVIGAVGQSRAGLAHSLKEMVSSAAPNDSRPA
jgi:hypothetical protein